MPLTTRVQLHADRHGGSRKLPLVDMGRPSETDGSVDTHNIGIGKISPALELCGNVSGQTVNRKP